MPQNFPSSSRKPLNCAGLQTSAYIFISIVLGVMSAACSARSATSPKYKLVWQDQFGGEDGSRPDASKWTYDLGGGGWGNHELEYYTDRAENARIEHGKLVISAKREDYTGRDGVAREYTSARLKTQGLFARAYGRFEARIKIPEGQGIWPAFWMLGDNLATAGWPKCGEIDVMENIGKEPGSVHGSLHGPGMPGPTSDATSTFALGGGKKFADDFHVFAVEWEPGVARFYVDSNIYASFDAEHWPAGGKWVFDRPFFIILNVAVGGDWPGSPDGTSNFPQKMIVDYVRVYGLRASK